MSYTKRQVIEAAMAELGLASYSFDLMPEQVEAALRRLDSMMAEWNGRGVRLAYTVPDDPSTSDVDVDSGLPDAAWEAAITNLALRLAPSYGKTVNPMTQTTARHALNTLFGRAAMPSEQKRSTVPAGAGHKSIDDTFILEQDEDLVAGPDATLDFN